MDPKVAALEASWRASTIAGNKAFALGDKSAAQRYTESISIAEHLFSFAWTDEDACRLAPLSHTISCHNLVSFEFQAERPREAHGFLLKAVETLVRPIESSASPEALRASCLSNLEHALAFVGETAPEIIAERRAAVLFKRAFALRAQARQPSAHWRPESPPTKIRFH